MLYEVITEVDDSNSPDNAGSYDKQIPRGVAISTRRGVSHYVDIENFAEGGEAALSGLGDILANKYLRKSSYDEKNAIAVLKKAGIEPANIADDVMVAAYLIDSGRRAYSKCGGPRRGGPAGALRLLGLLGGSYNFV